SAALVISHTRPAVPTGRDPTLGSALVAAAALGLGCAVALALVGAQHFGTEPAPLLQWTLSSTAPLALVLIGLGLMVTRTDPPVSRPRGDRQPWQDRLLFPLSAQVLVVLSTVSIVASIVDVPPVASTLWWKMQHVGAFAVGWAIALLVPANPW